MSTMWWLLRLLAVALALVTAPALAEETIRQFNTTVELRPDASVEVTEEITVNVEGLEIRRGIFRDVPTGYLNASGVRARSELQVLAVERDGVAEPYEVERLDNDFRRIRIGDPDVLIEHGEHTYTIRYTMTRMARTLQAAYDELYWNMTGNYWTFPIERATATVILPQGAVMQSLDGYTGPVGSTGQDFELVERSPSRAVLATTSTLEPGEGFTVSATFQKGVLIPASGAGAAANFLSDYRGFYLPPLVLLLVFGYNYWAWNRVGRDPPRGTIIPLFHPPEGMSPAQVHYIAHWGFRQNGWQAFTASIFNLGVKGLAAVDNHGKALAVEAQGSPPADLPPGEAELDRYFRSKGTVTVDKAHGRELEKQRSTFVSAVTKQSGSSFFTHNFGWALGGLALAVVLLGLLTVLETVDLLWAIVALVVGIVALFFSALGTTFRLGGWAARAFWVVLLVVLSSNLLGGLGGLFNGFHADIPTVSAISTILVNTAFMLVMRAPTMPGRRVMDQIEGFKMYLDTAEKNRLNIDNEPPMTVRRFEAILPYAIALGVEKPWTEHFEAELARNAVSDSQGSHYSPRWYRGRNFSTGSISNTVATAASAMSAAMIAAQPVSSSSSGSGGGGSSGGGGGGGGGGGW